MSRRKKTNRRGRVAENLALSRLPTPSSRTATSSAVVASPIVFPEHLPVYQERRATDESVSPDPERPHDGRPGGPRRPERPTKLMSGTAWVGTATDTPIAGTLRIAAACSAEIMINSVADEFGDGVESEFVQNAALVGANCLDAQIQLAGDVADAFAGDTGRQDVTFAPR